MTPATRVAVVILAVCRSLSAGEARFTEELWVPIEPQYQKAAGVHTRPAVDQRELLIIGMREFLNQLALKAPDPDWRASLIEDAARLPEGHKSGAPMSRPTEVYSRYLSGLRAQSFDEGLAAALAEYWINFELSKDRSETMQPELIEEMAQLTRVMNSVAARLGDRGRNRVKSVFEHAALLKLSFEEQ